MSDRICGDWLLKYLDYTQDQESPEKLHLWTAFTVLSAALRRRVWMSRGTYDLYPNIYVLIVAESATVRKSTAMNIGVDLLLDTIPKLSTEGGYITGKITPEGLVKQMNRTETYFAHPDDQIPQVRKESHILIHCDELATLFSYDKGRASNMAILLTEIYGRKRYMHTTKTDSQMLLDDLYPTLLAGTAPQNLKVLPEEIVGGLIGRIILVTAKEKRKPIAWPERSEYLVETKKMLRRDLEVISKLKGEMAVTPAGKALFKKWYEEMCEMEYQDPSIDAFRERCHDTALKIAMLISVSRSSDLIVDEEHVAGGIKFIEAQIPEFTRISQWTQSSPHGQNRAKFIDILKRRGGAADRRLLLKMLGIDIEEFNSLQATLIQEGTIEVRNMNKRLVIKLSEEYMKEGEPKKEFKKRLGDLE